MSILEIVILVVVGFLGGVISAVAGGAAIVTFPALLATGLSPVTAAVVNMVALLPGNSAAAYYDRRQLPPADRSFVQLIACSLAGALVGALLLLATPTRVFAGLVPLLLGFATLLFACGDRVVVWLARREAAAGGSGRGRWHGTIAAIFPTSVYAGYFGAGVGVLLLAVLSVGSGGDYRKANVLKNLVNSLNSVVATSLFVAGGVVVWPPTLAMMAGTIAGGLAGARIAQAAPRQLMRRIVVAIGAALTAAFAWRYWV